MDKGIFIDWLSFTVEHEIVSSYALAANVEESITKHCPVLLDVLPGQWEQRSGRAPYNVSFSQNGVTVFYNAKLNHILIEVSGKGCANLGESIYDLIRHMRDRVTRIDIAKDIQEDINPVEVLENTPVGRFKARSQIVSDTGETVYLGSRKSERFCRVYRYTGNHPRGGITRVEFTLRKNYGKMVAATLDDVGIDSLYSGLCDTFNLPDSVGIDANPSTLRLEIGERSTSKTLMWLNSAVLPALKRLRDSGELDPIEWLTDALRE